MARTTISPIVLACLPGRKRSLHSAAAVTTLVAYPAALLVTLFFASAANAETQPRNYACTVAAQTRSVELIYLAPPEALPCEIRRSNNKGEYQVLWRAEYDNSFCVRQFESYRKQLQGLGWQCKSGELSEPHSGGVTPRPATELTAAPEPLDGKTGVSQDEPAIAALYSAPEPPGKTTGNLTADDIREMDDWLIYLSAQTMVSIKQLTPDSDTFNDYQRREQLNSDNIYERLQNRIEFLNRIVNPAIAISTSDF